MKVRRKIGEVVFRKSLPSPLIKRGKIKVKGARKMVPRKQEFIIVVRGKKRRRKIRK